MIRTTLALLAVSALSGCAASASFAPVASSGNETQTQLAAYAGHASFPSTMPASTDLKAAAMVSSDQKMLKVYNFGSDPITDADVWVNGAFVYHVDSIAPQSSVTIPSAQLYNSIGAPFASQGAPFSRVQIKTANSLYTLWGPAAL